jgi:hypothetical protein
MLLRDDKPRRSSHEITTSSSNLEKVKNSSLHAMPWNTPNEAGM